MRIGVTGITGSFGRAFLQRCLHDSTIERVMGISRDEVKQADLAAEIGDPSPLRLFLADVRDSDRLEEVFWKLDVVIHAAALKRVEKTAYEPEELYKTNILGTINVIKAAVHAGVQRVVVLTSDKGVQPTNPYGVSKAAAEAFTVAFNAHSVPRGTRLACLRYGNVLGSRGSVVHLWRRQQAEHTPLTITDPRMTRFWLSLNQAVDFAWLVITRMEGGEIFVPMLPSMHVMDLADAVDSQKKARCPIGVRPGGEKLHEWLLTEEEIPRVVIEDPFYVVTPSLHSWRAREWTGPRLPVGFEYRSDRNSRWLSVEEMRIMLETV